jgi:uncharacterized protein
MRELNLLEELFSFCLFFRSLMTENPKFELQYPILFPLKVIGLDEPYFETFVIEIVRKHVPDLLEENIISKLSSNRKYRSVNFEFIAQSRTQVDALYMELGSHSRVIMIL